MYERLGQQEINLAFGRIDMEASVLIEHIHVAVPDGVRGDWRVESFTVSDEEARRTLLRAAVKGCGEYVPPGNYKRLMRGGIVVMSNTPMEARTHRAFFRRAKGSVLINGLGLGMVLTAILRKPEVDSVTVIEASAEVIDLVAPTFRGDPRVRIVHASAFDYQPAKGERFDAVWHDIWDYICADNLPEMHRLHRRYARHTDWQASWCRDQCEMQRGRYDTGDYAHSEPLAVSE